MRRATPRLAPLVLATMASQALLVVLSPTIVEVGGEFGASVSAVGQARSITAGIAVIVSLVVLRRVDAIGVPRLGAAGATVAIAASALLAMSPSLAVFLAGHVAVGIGLALLLSAGFAGVAAFPQERRAWAMGYVAGANALAWIVVNPIVGIVTDLVSWRGAHAAPALLALAALVTLRGAASPASAAVPPRLRTLFAQRSARLWIVTELIAYGAWTALLTFIGAFFIEELGVREVAVGWLLALGAASYFLASTRSGTFTRLLPRRWLIAGAAVVMGVLAVVQLNVTGSVILAAAIFTAIGFSAGIRTPASSGLGLEQLPGHPGAMMAARTAATQLGYLAGAVVGGAVIAVWGYGALGLVLAAGMTLSAGLILLVRDPLEARARGLRVPTDEDRA